MRIDETRVISDSPSTCDSRRRRRPRTQQRCSRRFVVHRYYDPATRQFLNVDPLVTQTNAPYIYAGDDPVNSTDPIGLSSICSSSASPLYAGKEEGPHNPDDLCYEVGTIPTPNGVMTVLECIDAKTGEVYYRYVPASPPDPDFPSNGPAFHFSFPHLPSPGKIGAALGIGGAAGVAVGGVLYGLGILAF